MALTPLPGLAERAADAAGDVLADIDTLVRCETSSYDLPRLGAGLDLLTDIAHERLGPPDAAERFPGREYGDVATLTFHGSSAGNVALVGHYDTVWPTGTLAGWPMGTVLDETGRARLTAPGIADMKTGLAQGIWALHLLRESGAEVPSVTFVFNGDEEIGSPASRATIERVGADADATLVLEPSSDGAVKTGRKGIGIFEVTATGVESHAGLDPEAGASAIHALAEFITAAAAVADPGAGSTINAGLISGGSGSNVVAGTARAVLDVRVSSPKERSRIDAAFDAIRLSDPRVRIDVVHGWNRPPMQLTDTSAPLLEAVRSVSRELGQPLLDVAVGGASDANFIAALGRPVLCGLGAMGGGPHSRGEFIYPDTVAHQTALVAGLLGRLTRPL